MQLKKTLLFLIIILSLASNLSADTNTTLKGLPQIAAFVKDICTSPSLNGSSSSFSLNAKASFKTNKLIRKLIALGVKGAAKYNRKNYNNVLQIELAKAIKDSNNCRLKALTLLKYHFKESDSSHPTKVVMSAVTNKKKGSSSSSASSTKGACGAYAGPDGVGSSCSNPTNSASSLATPKKATAANSANGKAVTSKSN